MTARRDPVPVAHVGGPSCDACGGSGRCGGRACGSCAGTGGTPWPAFLANSTGVCDPCDLRGDRRAKPIFVDEIMAVCASCMDASHRDHCGCGEAVATRRQLAEAKGLRAVKGGAA